jgi:hypothetical protein
MKSWDIYVESQRQAKEERIATRERRLRKHRSVRIMALADYRMMVIEEKLGQRKVCGCELCGRGVRVGASGADRALVRYIVTNEHGGLQTVSNGAIVCVECSAYMSTRKYTRLQTFSLDKKRRREFRALEAELAQAEADTQEAGLSGMLALLKAREQARDET